MTYLPHVLQSFKKHEFTRVYLESKNRSYLFLIILTIDNDFIAFLTKRHQMMFMLMYLKRKNRGTFHF